MLIFTRKNYITLITLISLIATLISIILAIYFFNQATKERKPVLLIDLTKTRIIETKRLSEAPLKIIRSNGEELLNDVSAIRIKFWNKGKLSIKPEDILKPITVMIDNPECEILDFAIQTTSREIVKPVINRSEENPKKIIELSFDILDYNDYFSFQIIFAGDPLAEFVSSGYIEGVPYEIKLKRTSLILSDIDYMRIITKYLNVSSVILIIGITVLSISSIRRRDTGQHKKIEIIKSVIFTIYFITAMIIMNILMYKIIYYVSRSII